LVKEKFAATMAVLLDVSLDRRGRAPGGHGEGIRSASIDEVSAYHADFVDVFDEAARRLVAPFKVSHRARPRETRRETRKPVSQGPISL